jgi:peptide/nickel transport system permease protein
MTVETSSAPSATSLTLRQWLMSDTPASRRQAVYGNVYRGGVALVSNPSALIGLLIVTALVLIAVFAPLVAGFRSPIEQSLGDRLAAPSWIHWFGTDELGRDIYARIVHGARVTLTIVALVSIVVAPVGLLIGTTAGYLGATAGTIGGIVDAVLMRITDIFLAFPRLVLALAFAGAMGPGIENAVIAISLTAWPPFARIARAETVTIARSDFISAVVLQGASTARILLRHIVPLCLSSVIVRLTLDMAGIILTAAGLGFLGLGAQPPTAEWGAMVSSGRDVILDQWWVATIPGLAIFIVSLGFNLLGDGLRDVLDPKSS